MTGETHRELKEAVAGESLGDHYLDARCVLGPIHAKRILREGIVPAKGLLAGARVFVDTPAHNRGRYGDVAVMVERVNERDAMLDIDPRLESPIASKRYIDSTIRLVADMCDVDTFTIDREVTPVGPELLEALDFVEQPDGRYKREFGQASDYAGSIAIAA